MSVTSDAPAGQPALVRPGAQSACVCQSIAVAILDFGKQTISYQEWPGGSALVMAITCLLPSIQHWLDPYVAHRLQQICRSCVCAQLSLGNSHALAARPQSHLPAPWRRPQSGRYTSSTRVSCIKPGSKPDDVVKRIERGMQLLQRRNLLQSQCEPHSKLL